ncbi:hypothetical protein QQ020_25985 [Fulvivirgaceae bacterium BMA12]|uniref:Transposase n=1 Tax=Agaribacillus aureus TaxID=3051825 RepID=A0ABT8LCR9_9BACT|nr:hypothetical protein [Fulvivirgaceae bacterium BMA12]
MIEEIEALEIENRLLEQCILEYKDEFNRMEIDNSKSALREHVKFVKILKSGFTEKKPSNNGNGHPSNDL